MSSLHISDIPVGASVKVRVPATSANLGPGYDSMGLGLGFYDELVVERIESGLEFELSGEVARMFLATRATWFCRR